jgi:hypothetical protein
LGLAAGWSLEAHYRFFATDAVGAGEVLEDGDLALISQSLHLLEQADSRELGELGETVDEIGLERLELGRRALLRRAHRRSAPLESSPDGVARGAQPASDGLDRNPLPVQRHDIHPLLQSDHAALPALGHVPGDSLLPRRGGSLHFVSRGSV